MKKNLLFMSILIAFVLASSWFTREFGDDVTIYLMPMSLLILSVFGVNIIIRNKRWAKSYFTGKFNFSEKHLSEYPSEIPAHLLFDKVLEVIEESNFTLQYADKMNLEILATTGFTMKSFGENMYIDFKEKDGKTIMKVCSVALFQATSWGRNESNCDKLLSHIEQSLII